MLCENTKIPISTRNIEIIGVLVFRNCQGWDYMEESFNIKISWTAQ